MGTNIRMTTNTNGYYSLPIRILVIIRILVYSFVTRKKRHENWRFSTRTLLSLLRCRGGFARFEFLNASGGIHHLGVSGVKRMTLTANLKMHLFLSGTNLKRSSAYAGSFGVRMICRVNCFLHNMSNI